MVARSIVNSIVRSPVQSVVGSAGGAPSIWTPARLFANSELGAWYDPSDMSTLFQDSAGTIPVTALDDPVGRMLDKSGNGHHATQTDNAKRPLLKEASGYRYLLFDGSNDCLFTSAINLTSTDKLSVCCGFYTTTAVRMIAEFSVGLGSAGTDGSWHLYDNGTLSVQVAGRGTGNGLYTPATVQNTVYVSHTTYDIAGAALADEIKTRINGTPSTAGGSGTMGTGNFGNHALFLGGRNNASLFLNGRIYGLIMRSGVSNADEVAASEQWMATKTGVTLA
jgi:hypothetical protein